ncbi:MAG TPA: ComF family protein [Devosia sp.]|nr:ComF family protein [Devosia sp.]
MFEKTVKANGSDSGPERFPSLRRSGQIALQVLLRLGAGVLDQLYPPACVHCAAVTGQPDVLCPSCWSRLRPITRPLCPVMGVPFGYDLGEGALSARAIADPPPFARARSAVVHNQVARTLVSRLKFGDRPELAKFCARLMVVSGQELFGPVEGEGSAPVLVPVPLHRFRHWQRRYNQSGLLAREVARQSGLTCMEGLVRRTRPTRPQIGLNARQRARNVRGAFAVHGDLLARLEGRPVIIVDDVITTGSTVGAISRVLNRAGVARVDVLSFSRVVIGADDG